MPNKARYYHYYWRSKLCDNTYAASSKDTELYSVGDEEPCEFCGDPYCYVTLKEGDQIVDINN